MKINNFQGELTDVSARKEALGPRLEVCDVPQEAHHHEGGDTIVNTRGGGETEQKQETADMDNKCQNLRED